jgi:hypothetical protein
MMGLEKKARPITLMVVMQAMPRSTSAPMAALQSQVRSSQSTRAAGFSQGGDVTVACLLGRVVDGCAARMN